jgi:deoxyribodipyrimidine photo-lyase
LAQGLHDLAQELRQRNVGFVLRSHPEHDILKFCSEVKPCLVIADENPLRGSECAQAKAARELSAPFWSVDSDVIVPTKLISKEPYAARTIRPKIHALLDEFLKPVHNPIAKVVAQKESSVIEGSLLQKLPIDRSAQPVSGFIGGAMEARRRLKEFLQSRLTGYAMRRNKPDLDGTSQLSPYLHFGHIAPPHRRHGREKGQCSPSRPDGVS